MRVGKGEAGAVTAAQPARNSGSGIGEESHHTDSLSAYLATISRRPLFSSTQERRLATRVQAGDARARDKLVEHNLRLVAYVARRYSGLGVDLEDLIQEGTLGLMKAAEKFDPRKGYKFSTYAHWWIRQAAGRAVADKSRTVRLPAHLHEHLSKLRKAEARLGTELGREPTAEELATELDIDREKVDWMQRLRKSIRSLDAPLSSSGEEEGEMSGLIAFLRDSEQAEEIVGATVDEHDHRLVEQALGILTERERYVIRRRYGLDGRQTATLEELARECEVNREAIRKAQRIAERKVGRELTDGLGGAGAA